MSEKVQLVLTDEALQVIAASATERKRGEFVSRIITEYASLLQDAPNEQQCGVLERIDSKLRRIEQKLDIVLRQAVKGEFDEGIRQK